MARIKIELPQQFSFMTRLQVRITDLNYGGHVGNDTILSIIHEARVEFLRHYGYEELNFEGSGLIMSDVSIEFKQEAFYPDILIISVTASDFSKVSFDIYYKIEKEEAGKTVLIATAKTGMVCFDYNKKKVTALPERAKQKLTT